MALWLERRDDKGQLIASGQFFSGFVSIADMTLSFDDARQLARTSSHLPVEKRDWALRILSED